jgi:hypothetical protein
MIMGRIFGALSIALGIIVLIVGFFVNFLVPSGELVMYVLAGLVIILAIIGLIKDDSIKNPKGLAIAGLLFGILIMVVVLLGLYGLVFMYFLHE